jgi:hypothetical protein
MVITLELFSPGEKRAFFYEQRKVRFSLCGNGSLNHGAVFHSGGKNRGQG